MRLGSLYRPLDGFAKNRGLEKEGPKMNNVRKCRTDCVRSIKENGKLRWKMED